MSQIRISQHGGWLMACSNEVKKSGGLRSFHRLDSFFVRDRFIGHVGLLQNSIYNLLFPHNRTFFDHFTDARFVRLQLGLLDHFSDDQAQHDTALGLLFEQLGRQLIRLEVATELLNGLHAQTVYFVADQGLRHFDRVGSQQAVHNLVLDLGLDGLAQLTLHVLAYFGTEAFQTAFFHAKQGEEVVIQLRQLRSADAVDGHGELGSFAGQIEILVVLGESRGDDPLFTSLDTDQSIFEARDHAAGAENQLSALGRTAGKGLTVDLADEIDIQLVAIFGGALNGFETGVLLAQDFQHVVDIAVSHVGLQALDGDGLETGNGEFREYFEGGNVLQILALLEGLRLNGRSAGAVELLLDHGLIEGGLDQVAQGLLARSIFVTLTDHTHRHFAGAETGNLGATGSLLQTLVDFSLDALNGNANGHTALKSRSAFNRNLHGYSSLHRHKPAVYRPRIKGMHSRG